MDQNLKKQKEEKIVKDAQERILKLLTEYKIPEADEEYEKVRGLLRQSWYATQRFPFHKEVERRERQEVEAKLRRIKAEEWKKQHRKEEKEQEEQQEREAEQRRIEAERLEKQRIKKEKYEAKVKGVKEEIRSFLYDHKFAEAEKKFREFDGWNTDDEKWFRNKKNFVVKEWFRQSVRRIDEKGDAKEIPIDDEQAEAIADMHKNTIVSARAGSGKTSTLVAKIVFLIATCKIEPEEILCFVFNKDAAEEVNKRLKSITVNGEFLLKDDTDTGGGELRKAGEIATTFHAFASRIVQNLCGEIGENEYVLSNERERLEYIQEIIKEIPIEKVYDFFRSESMELKRNDFKTAEEYEEARKHVRYTTLDFRIVKSKDEKIISDFLFERGIDYMYEIEFYLSQMKGICRDEKMGELEKLKNEFNQDSIKCDFYLPKYGIVWEHWGVTGNETIGQIKKIDKSKKIGKYKDYKDKMEWKQWFYQKEWIDKEKFEELDGAQAHKYRYYNFKHLVETQYQNGRTREDFEQELEAKLKKLGVKCEKLSWEEIQQKIYEKQIKRFSGMIGQFISRATKQYFDNLGRLETEIQNSDIEDPRVRSFMEIGMECCRKYVQYMKEKREIIPGKVYVKDFDLLVYRAMQIIVSRQNQFLLQFLGQIRFILVDEYQDFSRLFLGLILKIRELCKDAKLFVVGDDWQAINRFAGSNVRYFKDFKQYFPEDEVEIEISTNYRSGENIVESAREFVRKSLGEKRKFRAKENGGRIRLINPDDTWMEMRDGYDNLEESVYEGWLRRVKNKQYRNLNIDNEIRYAKTLGELLTEIFVKDQEKNKTFGNNRKVNEVFVLHRNNENSFYLRNYQFVWAVAKALTDLGKLSKADAAKIKVKTIHGAKGLEADTVIILEADDGVLPMYHQDTLLYQIFGETTSTELDDQKRLFYVAMTRAKHQLYILHREERRKNKKLNDEDHPQGFIKYLDFSK